MIFRFLIITITLYLLPLTSVAGVVSILDLAQAAHFIIYFPQTDGIEQHYMMPDRINILNPCAGEQGTCNITGKKIIIHDSFTLPVGSTIFVTPWDYSGVGYTNGMSFSTTAAATFNFEGICTYPDVYSRGEATFLCSWQSTSAQSVTIPVISLTQKTVLQQNLRVEVNYSPGYNASQYQITLRGNVTTNNATNYQDPSYIDTHFSISVAVEGAKYSSTIEEGCCGVSTGSLVSEISMTGGNNGTIYNRLTPESLTATFSPDAEITHIDINRTGQSERSELSKIFLRSDGKICAAKNPYTMDYKHEGVCQYSLENTTITLTCPDPNPVLQFEKSNIDEQMSTGLLGTIFGSWGRVNIDTTCAITVTIPYE